MGGAGLSRRVRWGATVLAVLGAMLGILGGPPRALAQDATVTSLGTDRERNVDRYQVVIQPGASLWELGANHLPFIALEHGELKAVELIEQAWRAQYGERQPPGPRPGDSFVLEVPIGTFVARSFRREDDRLLYESFTGDQLATFPRDSQIAYRLVRATSPDRAEVLINGGQASVIDETKRVYGVEQPDFLQVRTVRGALGERQSRLTVDLTKPYLDDFRLHRDRAVRVDDGPDGLRVYTFDRNATEIPFVRVEDGVGTESDPGNFPKVFRVAYYRDGTVRRYVVTEAGDSLGNLSRPESAHWAKILPSWQDWLPGEPEALPPFTPAVSASGALLPGRILVLASRPRIAPVTPRPTRSASGSSGLDCAGLPLGLVLAAGAFIGRQRLGLP